MAVAAASTARNGFWALNGGCEVPFCYGALASVIGFTGPGAWSLDHRLGLTGLAGGAWGSAALAAGLLAAAVPLTIQSRVRRSRPADQMA
jgi:putative oxidoreductase